MFDSIVDAIVDYPYLGVALLFLLCGMGLPLPEEIVLIAGGYICAKFPDKAALPWMMVWCAGAILSGDFLPYLLGRTFGPRLLRLRWLRVFATRKRLGSFDRWFRRRGDLVIFIARFLPGIRSVAFFTAGSMKMRLGRFLLLDSMGIVLIVPLLTWVGYHSASYIDVAIERVQQIERGILWAVGSLLVLAALWYWLWRRQQRLRAAPVPTETYVEPQLPVIGAPPGDPTDDAADGGAPPAPGPSQPPASPPAGGSTAGP